MRVKPICLFVLSLLLVVGLFQINAIGNLNPVFHSIAGSIHRLVNWVWKPYPPQTKRIILPLKQEFLNTNSSQDDPPISVTKPASQKRDLTGMKLDKQEGTITDDAFDFLDEDFSYSHQNTQNNSVDSRQLLFLQEMVASGDPVTDLFPETGQYDEIDNENWTDLLEKKEEGVEIPLDELVRPELVEPLLDEINTQIQQKLESNELEEMPDK